MDFLMRFIQENMGFLCRFPFNKNTMGLLFFAAPLSLLLGSKYNYIYEKILDGCLRLAVRSFPLHRDRNHTAILLKTDLLLPSSVVCFLGRPEHISVKTIKDIAA